MEMTTPVFTRKAQSLGERMEMTTPVITKKVIVNLSFIKCNPYWNVLLASFYSILLSGDFQGH